MKLLSIVSVVFSMGDLVATIKKILKGIFLNDKEGVALSLLSITILASDILDSITTFVNATLALLCKTTVAAFSTMGLPLAFVMSGFGTVSRTIQIAKSLTLYRDIHRLQSQPTFTKTSLKNFLERAFGYNEEMKRLLAVPLDQLNQADLKKLNQLKEKSHAAILRAAPMEAVKDLEALFSLLEENVEEIFNEDKHQEISKLLRTVQSHLRKKSKMDAFAIIANLFTLTAASLFAIGSSGSLPFILLALAFSVRLGIVICQNKA